MSMNMFSPKIWAFRTAMVLLVGMCTFSSAYAAPNYYKEFGEKAGITNIINAFVANVAADNRINWYFAHTDILHLKKALVNQVCGALGGPCQYKGPSMKKVHQGMGVTQAAFNALTEDLMLAMTKYNVSIPAQNHLIKILAPMSHQIITK